MVSGSHTIHLLKGYGCAVCHADTASSNTTIKDLVKHVNGSVDVAFSAPFTGMAWNSALRTCTGACHSDGRGGAPQYTPTWGAINNHECGFCHPMPPATGAHLNHMPSPANYNLLHQSYSSTGVWSTTTDYAFGCANCHPKNAAFHVNGSVDLSLDSTEGGPIKGKNRTGTQTSGYTQTTGVSVVCSASYCHGGSTDSFTYWSMDGSGEMVPVTVTMHPTPQVAASPDWYGSPYAGNRCAMCHGNPPTGGTWHSGNHANQGLSGSANQCQLCHSDAVSTNGSGTAVTDKSVHLNGTIDLSPNYQSSCFGCH
jgi:predicted CxxxxCH...CXXCH cytochrome family protein